MTTTPKPRVVTFGEIMLRLASSDGVRLAASRTLDATFGGGEANVAISLARMGVDAAFVTALPDNDLGKAARHFLAGHGVDVAGDRDSAGAAWDLLPGAGCGTTSESGRCTTARSRRSCDPGPDDFAWESLLAGAAWFHTTGITPALSAVGCPGGHRRREGGACRRRDGLGRPELPRQAVELGQTRRGRDG